MIKNVLKVVIKKEVNLRIVAEFQFQIQTYQKSCLILAKDNMKRNLITTKKYKKFKNRNNQKYWGHLEAL